MSDPEVKQEIPDPDPAPPKKKRLRLSVRQKIVIIDRLSTGESKAALAEEFGVSTMAITKISKNIENIINYKNAKDCILMRKTLSKLEGTIFEKVVYMWYKQKRCLGEAVPGTLLQKKALELNTTMKGPESFRASISWVQKFKDRHNIRNVAFNKPSLEDESASRFCKDFTKFLKENNVNPNNVYNADEMTLGWKSIPTESQSYRRRSAANVNVDKVTVMVCTNASGSHKLPLLVIGNEDIPEPIPVMYKVQKDGRMTEEIFRKWYKELFLPELRERHPGDSEKCILLIDNAPPHPSAEYLNEEDNICEVKILPTDVTTLQQPVNQGVTLTLKTIYKIHLMKNLLAYEPLNLNKFYSGVTLKDCCNFLTKSWSSVTKLSIKNAWQKVIKLEKDWTKCKEDPNIQELLEMLRKLPCCSRFTAQSARYWVEEDNDDQGWVILSEDQIIKEVTARYAERKQVLRKILDNRAKQIMRPKSPKVSEKMNGFGVLIKEEVDEGIVENSINCEDEFEIKQENIDEEEAIDMEQNVFFFQECSSDLQMESSEEESKVEPESMFQPEGIIETENIAIENVWSSNEATFLPKKHSVDKVEDKKPSAFDAMTSIDLVYKWFESKTECGPQDLIRLRQMREIARKEILCTSTR